MLQRRWVYKALKRGSGARKAYEARWLRRMPWLGGGKTPHSWRSRDNPPPHSASSHGGADPRRRRPFRKASPYSLWPWPVLAGCRLHPSEVRVGRWPAQLSVGLPQGGGSDPRFPRGAGKPSGAVSWGGVGEGGLWEHVGAEFYFSRRSPRHCFCRAACLQNYSCVLVSCPSQLMGKKGKSRCKPADQGREHPRS